MTLEQLLKVVYDKYRKGVITHNEAKEEMAAITFDYFNAQ